MPAVIPDLEVHCVLAHPTHSQKMHLCLFDLKSSRVFDGLGYGAWHEFYVPSACSQERITSSASKMMIHNIPGQLSRTSRAAFHLDRANRLWSPPYRLCPLLYIQTSWWHASLLCLFPLHKHTSTLNRRGGGGGIPTLAQWIILDLHSIITYTISSFLL